MKKLWRRATGKIKDRNSLIMASMTRKSRYRNPDLEAAVIKATSHDETFVDYKNAQRVFTWVRTSPSHLTVVLWALTRRVQRTRDFVVAIKSLILLHGIFCTKAPGTRRIGRLPFDLSAFDDAYTHVGSLRWAFNTFVQAYFGFVDSKSVVLAAELKEETVFTAPTDTEDQERKVDLVLIRVQRWQDLLDAVQQVKPERKDMMEDILVVEAMDCMIIEVFELYSKICEGIATALMKIYTDRLGKSEQAATALEILHKANRQGQDLALYFEFCKKFGLLHASECPKIEEIPKEDFVELERIINGDEVSSEKADCEGHKHNDFEGALVVIDDETKGNKTGGMMKTVITDKWEVFEEDSNKVNGNGNGDAGTLIDPFAASYNIPPLIQFNPFIDYGGATSQLVIGLS